MQPQGEKPCQRECCELSPFVPGSEKPIVASPIVAILASAMSPDPVSPGEVAVLTTVLPQPLPLHILHCQWRC